MECTSVVIFGERCNGTFTVKAVIGKGGFGTVYSICDSTDNCNELALKIVSKDDYEKTEVDIQAAASIPTIKEPFGVAPKIVEVIINNTHVGIIMERIKYTMRDIMTDIIDNTLLDLSKKKILIIELIREAVLLVFRLHSRGIVHMDPNLGNIAVDKNDQWIFIDFGMSKTDLSMSYYDFSLLIDQFFSFIFKKFGADIFVDFTVAQIFPNLPEAPEDEESYEDTRSRTVNR